MSQTIDPHDMARHEASFVASCIKKAVLSDDAHDMAVYLEQAQKFLDSSLAFARQASMEDMVEHPPKAAAKPKPKLTLVHSKE